MKRILLIGLLLAVAACTSDDDVKKYAEMEGWDSYEVTGYRIFGCSKDDWFHTGFTAIKNGRKFSGVVCAGPLKGATLRLD
jgi:hypothetical protein